MKLKSVSSSGSSSIHSIFTPSELALELEWLAIRDMLLGVNCSAQEIPRALELSSTCQHQDAQYLDKIFGGKTVCTKEEAKKVFLDCESTDSRALCFSELVTYPYNSRWDLQRLRRSAELGFGFALAMMAGVTSVEESFKFAQASVFQHEREGFHALGWCYKNGRGCEKNLEYAKENYLIAAEFGSVAAMSTVGELLDETDSRRWIWLGRAALKGESWGFLSKFCKLVRDFKSGSGSAACLFQIGRALNGHVDMEKREIFGNRDGFDFDSLIGSANDAISFYQCHLGACRRSVDTWTLVGIRFGTVKYIRLLIARMIWASRDFALCKVLFAKRHL